MADASAVQFTRNPDGLASALSKIAGTSGSRSLIASPKAAEASHLFFSPPIKAGLFSGLFGAMATHPPLSERIRRLSGQKIYRSSSSKVNAGNSLASNPTTSSLAGSESPVSALTSVESLGATSQTTLQSSASQTSASLIEQRFTGLLLGSNLSQAFLEQLPDLLVKAVRSQVGAVAVVYGILLDKDENIRQQQKTVIANSSPVVLKALLKVEPILAELEQQSYLSLLDLCIPSLTKIQLNTISQSLRCVQSLIRVNGKLSISEFAIKTILHYRLAPHFQPHLPSPSLTNEADVAAESQLLISALARAKYNNKADAYSAFRDGCYQLPKAMRSPLPSELPNCSLPALSKALKHLQVATPDINKQIASACTYTVVANGKTTGIESDLLRAILVALCCPLPACLEANTKQYNVRMTRTRAA